MLFGVGASLARQIDRAQMLILPAPSSYSLAAARLGWALQDVQTLSVVAAPVAAIAAHLASGMRLLVLSNDRHSRRHRDLAARARLRAQPPDRAETPRRPGRTAYRQLCRRLEHPPGAALNLVAIDCLAASDTPPVAHRRLAGLGLRP